MPSVMSVIPRLEGILSTYTATNEEPDNPVATWVEMVKATMRQPALRDQTDWDIFVSTLMDDATSEAIDASAATVYAVLGIAIGTNDDVIFSLYNHATPTVASTDLNDGGNLVASFVVRNASATATTYGGVVFPGGIACATALEVAATERDEGALVADTTQSIVVYRSN